MTFDATTTTSVPTRMISDSANVKGTMSSCSRNSSMPAQTSATLAGRPEPSHVRAGVERIDQQRDQRTDRDDDGGADDGPVHGDVHGVTAE